jgi:hypothetical protein
MLNYPKNSLAGEIVKEGKVESTTIFGIHCCAAVGYESIVGK